MIARWLLSKLLGPSGAEAVLGDLREAFPSGSPSSVMRNIRERWSVVFQLGWHRARQGRGGSASPVGLPSLPHQGRSGPDGALLQDLRFAVRTFRARPTVAIIAILSLGLGIGANAAIFALLDAVLLSPLPVPGPEQVVTSRTIFSFPDYRDLQAGSGDALSGLAAWHSTSRAFSLEVADTNWAVDADLVTGNFFEVLQVAPRHGRLLSPTDDADAASVAVISARFWNTAFDGDPSVVGREIRVNGMPTTIIGIAPARFRGLRLSRQVDVWMPLSVYPTLARGSAARLDLEDRGAQWLRIIGRLRAGTSPAQAEGVMLGTAAALIAQDPSPYLEDFEELQAATAAAVSRADEVEGFLRLMGAMVVVALLVACINVANVLLASAAGRRREIGMRMVLGAKRGRLIRQLLTESLLLALFGGIAGIGLAQLMLRVAGNLQIPGQIELSTLPTVPDLRTLAFTTGLAFLCALLFGTLPALSGTRPDPMNLVRAGGDRPGRASLPAILICAQIGLTLALLFGGGLFVRSLSTALDVDLGFEPGGVAVAVIDLGMAGYTPADATNFHRAAIAAVESIPEVSRAAWAVHVPVRRGRMMETFRVVDHELRDDDPRDVTLNFVSPGFFETLGVRLPAGRAFLPDDTADAPPVIVVNETFANHFWPDGRALGEHVLLPGPEVAVELEVIGVARDIKHNELREDPVPYIYLAIEQWSWLIGADSLRLAMRTTIEPGAALDEIRLALSRVDPAVPILELGTLDDQIFELLMPQRLGATLLGTFALLTLALAAVGVYGVVSNAMLRRVREMAIRRAVGARGVDVARLVLRRGMIPVLVGIPLGWIVSFWLSRLLASFLPGLDPLDPATLAATTFALAAVAAAACCLPAGRASRLDPARSLRAD